MAVNDSLREHLIKQYAADVVIMTEKDGKEYYACPTCKHYVSKSNEKCMLCDQVLKWDNIRKIEIEDGAGAKKAVLKFEVPADFAKSDCRKCPISYIARSQKENIYECPLGKRLECPLDFE